MAMPGLNDQSRALQAQIWKFSLSQTVAWTRASTVAMAAGKPHLGVPVLMGLWHGLAAAFAEVSDGALLETGWEPLTIWGAKCF